MKKIFKFLALSCLILSLWIPTINVEAAEVQNVTVLNTEISPEGVVTSTATNLAAELTEVKFNYYSESGELLTTQQVAVAEGSAATTLELKSVFTKTRYFTAIKVEVATLEDVSLAVSEPYTIVSGDVQAVISNDLKTLHLSLTNLTVPRGCTAVSFVYHSTADNKNMKAKATKAEDGSWVADVPVANFSKHGLGTYEVTANGKFVNGVHEIATTTFELNIGSATLGVDKSNANKAIFRIVIKKIKTVGEIKDIDFTVKAGKIKKTYKAEELTTGKYGYIVDTHDFKLYQGTYNISATVNLKNGVSSEIATAEFEFEPVIKNGWYYEKAYGKKYKYYYKDGVRQEDLTKLLKLPTSNGNPSMYKIIINRAACVVNVLYYDTETKTYCIPVKSFTVSVGADIWTKAGAAGLSEKTSYTPIGKYSISSNGVSTKYTVKEMHEPDGSVLYARWASHIVGNVYFHSIAVGADSHYSLPASTFNKLGKNVSAGCIRMCVADAKWIYDYAPKGTPVIIEVGNKEKPGPYGKPATITINKYIGYDPTDPEVPDSRKKKDYKAGKMTGYMTKSGKKVGY